MSSLFAVARRVYCLRCFETLPRETPVGARCDRCGFPIRPRQRRTFWNLSPFARALEALIKGLTIALTALLMFLIGTTMRHAGTGAGFAIAAPIFLAVLLWRTASLLTRHEPAWSPAVAWISLLVLLGIGFALLGPPIEVLAVVDGTLLLLAIAVWIAGLLFRRWKARRMAEDGADGDSSVTKSFPAA
jgi:hypothetical protein